LCEQTPASCFEPPLAEHVDSLRSAFGFGLHRPAPIVERALRRFLAIESPDCVFDCFQRMCEHLTLERK
jgi:hypothetical protein